MVDKPKGDIVNLNRARKDRARAARQDAAEANRAKHGATRAAKSLTEAREQKAARDLEAHKRETGQDGDGSKS
jgi:hypothetical protein